MIKSSDMTPQEKKLAEIEARIKSFAALPGTLAFEGPRHRWRKKYAEDAAYLLSELRKTQEELRRVRHEAYLAKKVIDASDSCDYFSCPHYGGRCGCGDTQIKLAKEWNLAKMAYDKAVERSKIGGVER